MFIQSEMRVERHSNMAKGCFFTSCNNICNKSLEDGDGWCNTYSGLQKHSIMHYGWKCGKAPSNLWFKLEVNLKHFFFLFDICAILKVIGYVEEGCVCARCSSLSWNPISRRNFRKIHFLGFWHQCHD